MSKEIFVAVTFASFAMSWRMASTAQIRCRSRRAPPGRTRMSQLPAQRRDELTMSPSWTATRQATQQENTASTGGHQLRERKMGTYRRGTAPTGRATDGSSPHRPFRGSRTHRTGTIIQKWETLCGERKRLDDAGKAGR